MNDLNKTGDQPVDPRRATILLAMMGAVFAAYSIHLFDLQIRRGVEYRAMASTIARQTTTIPAQRGEIYDRNVSSPLVLNIDSFAVDLVPAELPAALRDTVFQKLAVALGQKVDELRAKVPPEYYHLYQPIELAQAVDYGTVTSLAERADEFPGVAWRAEPKRSYAVSGSFSHILGYVGDITREELKVLYNKGYKTGDLVGKAGIEKQYDALLRGKDGREYSVVDVRGRAVTRSNRAVDQPVMGSNLVLSIDRRMQELAEDALGERMGSVVVLKPATGEVLALVSYPSYDPNLFIGAGGNNAYAALLNDGRNPLINRAIQSSYPPASTFKAIMTTAILEEQAVSPDKEVLCEGQISYGERVWRCWNVHPGHGKVDLEEALEQSCDIYFWVVGRDNLGIERIVAYSTEFGLGTASGIDLPGEVDGFVPTPQWKERRFHEKWLAGDTMNVSIGQGFTLATPLQMANAYAMIVNDGVIYRPHVLKEVRDASTGAVVSRVEPEAIARSRTDPAVFAEVRKALRGVITQGTARYAINTKAVEVAGKTGTAEVGLPDRWHSWLASWAPYDAKNPEDVIVVVVMVEASNPWEWWATYATNIIHQGWFSGQTYDEAVAALGMGWIAKPSASRME